MLVPYARKHKYMGILDALNFYTCAPREGIHRLLFDEDTLYVVEAKEYHDVSTISGYRVLLLDDVAMFEGL